MTISDLRAFGADVDSGLGRCLNNADLYLRLVKKACADSQFDLLKEAVERGDLEKAFEAAHGLKGVSGNLSLTPIYRPVSEMTELLRARASVDYRPYLEAVLSAKASLEALCAT